MSKAKMIGYYKPFVSNRKARGREKKFLNGGINRECGGKQIFGQAEKAQRIKEASPKHDSYITTNGITS